MLWLYRATNFSQEPRLLAEMRAISEALQSDFRDENSIYLRGYTFNDFITTLKPQSNGPSYSNTVIGTLAIDGWAVTFGTARRGLGGQSPPHCTKQPTHQRPVYQVCII